MSHHLNMACLAALGALLVSCAAPPPPPPPPEHLFSELRPGDRIHVHFRSDGCLHNVAYSFDFERGARTTVRIASLGRAWSPITPNFDDQVPHFLGTLTLSQRDIRGLDNLVNFYRGHPDGYCSTAEHIAFEYPQYVEEGHDPRVVTERYTDLSCDNLRLPGLTTLPSLARRLERRDE
jgi:hypothetical protein